MPYIPSEISRRLAEERVRELTEGAPARSTTRWRLAIPRIPRSRKVGRTALRTARPSAGAPR